MIWLIRIICFPMSIGLVVLIFVNFEGMDTAHEWTIRIVAATLLGILLNIWYKAEKGE